MPNNRDPMYMQQMQYMNAPPDIQAGASEIFQRQKLAELLRQQAMEPIKADEYSKTGSGQWAAPPQIVKVGMGQGLAKLAEAGVGGYMQNQANEDSLALANQLRDRRAGVIGDITSAMEGKPATQGYDAVAGYNTGGDTPGMVSTYEDGTPQPVKDIAPQSAVPGQDAVPPADKKALAKLLMNSGFSDLEKLGETQLFAKPDKAEFHTGAAGSQGWEKQADGTWKQVFSVPQKTQYENSSNLSRLIAERAELAVANPSDERLKTYDNAIRKESETARQISPVIKIPSQGHIVDTPNGLQVVKDGVMTPVVDAKGKPAVGNKGSLNLAGGRESVQIGRLIGSANQASKDLENISKLPLTASSGFLGGRGQGQGLLEAGKETLTNKMTTQEVQSYNAMTAGLQRSLASLEAMGLMPNVNLTKQMESVVFRDGDTHLTKMHKLAQTRQIIEATQETLEANPRVAPEQKKLLENVLAKVKKSVPFTHSDLIDLTAAQQKNPSASMKSIIAARDKASAASGGDAPAGWSKEEWAALTPEEKKSLGK